MFKRKVIAFMLSVCLIITPSLSVCAGGSMDATGEDFARQGTVATESVENTEEAGAGAAESAVSEKVEEESAATEAVEEESVATEAGEEESAATEAVEEESAATEEAVEEESTATEIAEAKTAASDSSFILDCSTVDEGWSGTQLTVAEAADGSRYVVMNGDKYANRTATHSLGELPNMGTAKVAFKWYTNALTSDGRSGRPGVVLKSGDTEVVAVYMGEARGGDATEAVYYSVQGMEPTVIPGRKLKTSEANNVVIDIDFSTLKAKISINGEVYLTVDVNAAATKIDTLVLSMAGGNGASKTYYVNMGIGDFSVEYTDGSSIQRTPHIVALSELSAVTATKAEYEAGFAHYSAVEAVLSNDQKVSLEIAADSWKADRELAPDEMGSYIWTGDIVLPADGSIANHLNLQVSYEMKYMSDFLETDIDSLKMPDPVVVRMQQWESGEYRHPDKVSATLVDGRIITVSIDQDTWECEPDFDGKTKGVYEWTAEIVEPENNRNHRELKVSYIMNYYGDYVSAHDYENDFTFREIDWGAWGKDIDVQSGTGGYGFSIKEEADGNLYLYASVDRSAGRGSRLNLLSDYVKKATMEFDWMPAVVSSNHADLLFMSPAARQNYFTLYAEAGGAIKYYTASDSNNSSVLNHDFTGVIGEADAVDTGVAGLGKWYTVKLDFDYINHTADLTVTPKEDPGKEYIKTGIPISPDANGLSIFVMRKFGNCKMSENGLDNIYVDYERYGENDIVSVRNPANISMIKERYDEYEFPGKVTVVLGNGDTKEIPAGEWKSDPEFNRDQDYAYTWTAPLTTGSYTNYFGLEASFVMDYTQKPYVTSVYNPPTLELEYGDAWDEGRMPKEATVILITGEILEDAPVGEWTAIRAFDGEKEGIYVYGANLAEDVKGRYMVEKDRIVRNEWHAEGSEYIYDVYYRVSYYKSNNNYNGYVRSMEYLDRGVSAVKTQNGILVSWRLFVEEYGKNVQFNVLRNGTRINSRPLSTKTNYLDQDGRPGDRYTIEVIGGGAGGETEALAGNYLSIKLQKPEPQPDTQGNLATYSINDTGVADVDGDGQYEILVKWMPSDGFDSGKWGGPSAPTIFDCYRMDGTALWRLNLGLELSSGAHWNQFMFYDMDEDGKAEFFIKTSDGTISYRPNAQGLLDMTDESTIISYIGDRSVVPGTNVLGSGHISVDSNEYVSVFNGLTGEEIDTIDYVNQVDDFNDYGDGWGNRASRFNIALAYLPRDQKDPGCTETIPAVLLNRGYYAKTTVAAYTLRNGKLQLEWNFDSDVAGKIYGGRGNHNMSTGDVDQDGFDELVIGALAIDHDGSVLWCKDGKDGQDDQGHADAIHLAAMNPDKPTQLYVATPSEGGVTLNSMVSNAANGSRISGTFTARADVGRGVAANIAPYPGFEFWANKPNNESAPTGGIFNTKGKVLASAPPSNFSTNWVAYWDGDLLSELADGRNKGTGGTDQAIYKYDWVKNELNTIEIFWGTHTNNWTKNNPCLSADLFGDWREEFMVADKTETELRIYMTGYETEYGIYTLMQDPVYRNAVANQNTAYNQPPHVGFYLGEDNRDDVLAMKLPTPKIRYTIKPEATPEPTPVPNPGQTQNVVSGPTQNVNADPTTGAASGRASEEVSAPVSGEIDIPEETAPQGTIGEAASEETPGEEAPEEMNTQKETDAKSETVNVEEEEAPLAVMADTTTGSWALLNLLLVILTALAGLGISAMTFMGKRRFMSVIPVFLAGLTFILTEKPGGSMVFADRWTVLMLAYAMANVVFMVLSARGNGMERDQL